MGSTDASHLGFRTVKAKLIQSLKSLNFRHGPRDVRQGKNLLATEDLTVEEVIGLVSRCRGNQYHNSRHHLDSTIVVHIFEPSKEGTRWYIKVYFQEVEPDVETTVFISVHESSSG